MATPSETKRPDLNLLAMEVHANAERHGFWHVNTSCQHCLCLVICELAEAVDADRKGNTADVECYKIVMQECEDAAEREADPKQYQYELESNFKLYIKDTVGDELADATIRLLDIAGAKQLPITTGTAVYEYGKQDTFTERIYDIMHELTDCQLALVARVNNGISLLEKLADTYDIDLWWQVQEKMRYNQNRPYKHGKKY